MSAPSSSAAKAEPAGSVRRLVANAWRAHKAGRAAELLLVFASGTCLSAAFALHSGGEPSRASLFAVGLLGGVLAALSFLGATRTSARALAHALDERLECAGALQTAWEVEGGAGAGAPMVRLLSARASAGLRRRELMRAAVPSLAPNLCACLVCVALWAWALEAQRAQDAPVQALARGLEETLRSARALALGEEQMGSAGGVGMAQELGELSRSAAELARAETPEQQLEALEALEAELSELSREGAGDRALAEQLAAAESWGGALRAALARDEAGSPGPGQTPPAPDGTMSGSPPSSARPGGHPGQTDALPVASSTGPGEPGAGAAQEGGAGAAPTWPPRFDPLVERWIQIASADTPPDPQPPEHP